jgi:small subunit ribosomal protein S3
MGQKAHPKSLRLGIIKDWDSTWFAEGKYKDYVMEDFEIRNSLKGDFERAGVAQILIKRKSDVLEATVHVGRPGVVFGKNAMDLKIIKEALSRKINKKVQLNVVDVKNVDANARLLVEWVVGQLVRRIPFRRAMKMAMQKAMRAGVKGIRIGCAGRLGGVEIARREWYREGKVPLHTFRADIDYAFGEALTTYGKIGVKVWLYHGEVLDKPAIEDVESQVGEVNAK